MKTRNKISAIILLVTLLITTNLIFVNADVPVPSLTINFDSAADMTYFNTPTDNLGTWVIEDGILKQTIPAILDVNGWPVQPILPAKQCISLKNQMLKDYEIEFDFITATTAEIADIFTPSVSARMMLLATNVPDGTKYAVSTTNGGLGFAHTDPKAWGGTTKRMTIADLGLTDSINLDHKSPVYKVPTADPLFPYILGSSPTSANVKYFPFEPSGIHTFKIVKVGTNVKYYYKNVIAADAGTVYTDLAKYLRADYELIYEITVDSKFDVAGAVQFIAGSGVVRYDNIKITSSDLNLAVYATPTPIPTATEAPSPTVTEAPSPTVTEAPSPTVTEAPTPTVTEEVFASDAVIALIDALPETITIDNKDAILAARAAYDALSEEQKSLVSNYYELQTAEAALETVLENVTPTSEPTDSPSTNDNFNFGFVMILFALAAASFAIVRKSSLSRN